MQKQQTNPAPIALFVYNRLWHTRQTIEALQKNHLASESDLFIFSDAAKTTVAKTSVEEVRNYIKTISRFKSVKVIEREENFGLAKSIIAGVTFLCDQYERAIVVEDDLVTSPYFLQFMNDGLEFYKDREEVMHLSGYMYPVEQSDLPDTFFLRPTSCWGWATWKRSWKYFEKDTDKLLRIFSPEMIRDFNIFGSNDYFSQIVHNKEGKINTWAIYWQATVFLKKGLSLHPKISFVQNIGHDGSGIHCEPSEMFDGTLANSYPIRFEEKIELSLFATKRLAKYFNSIKVSFFTRVKRKISRILN